MLPPAPAAQEAICVEGCLAARAGRAAILRYPLSTALPIPLAVTGPPGIHLATWAFAGLRAEDPLGPRGLLVLALDEGAALREELRLTTHFRAFEIALGGADEPLRPEERSLVARAVLAAASPDETGLLAGLVELLGEELAAIALGGDAPVIAPGEGRWALSGSSVPGHLLLCGEAGWSCHRIARADLRFGHADGRSRPAEQGPLPHSPRDGKAGEHEADGPGVQSLLTLDRVWGEAAIGRPTYAIGLTTNGFTPYRIAR